jgi:hypothetical protein
MAAIVFGACTGVSICPRMSDRKYAVALFCY